MGDCLGADQVLTLEFAVFFAVFPISQTNLFCTEVSNCLLSTDKNLWLDFCHYSSFYTITSGFVVQRLSGFGDLTAALDHCNVTRRAAP